jgi:hypothetical protein
MASTRLEVASCVICLCNYDSTHHRPVCMAPCGHSVCEVRPAPTFLQAWDRKYITRTCTQSGEVSQEEVAIQKFSECKGEFGPSQSFNAVIRSGPPLSVGHFLNVSLRLLNDCSLRRSALRGCHDGDYAPTADR